MFSYKEWYEKNRDKQLLWQKNYYEENKEHVLEMHKIWAEKNVDQGGSVWRKYGRRRRIKNPNLDKEYRLRKKARLMGQKPLSDLNLSKKIQPYKFFYWGPLLLKVKLQPEELKACAKLCSKKSSLVTDTLAGVIKHEHYISPRDFFTIISPYLQSFRVAHQQWYGKPLIKDIITVAAWVNFMASGEFNPPHIHQNCDFSSVLFVKIPDKLKEENKKFPGAGGGPGSVSFHYGENQPFSLTDKNFLPEEGDFFIFPATLMHFVPPFMSQEERISISANFRLS